MTFASLRLNCPGNIVALKEYPSSIGRLAYDKRGWGDPLVLVHGIYPGASHDEFRRNIDALSKHFTIYALDLIGYGDSDMPRTTYTAQLYHHLIRDFIVEEIGQPSHVLASGKSCGPVVAMAVYNDSLVKNLVLIDPVVDPSQVDPGPNIAGKVQQFLLGTLSLGMGMYETITSDHELRRFLYSRYASPKNVTEARVAELKERATRRHAVHAFISDITGHLAIDLPRWLKFVRAETLILWGKHAGEPPTGKLLTPAAWSRGKRFEIVEDAAHWPHDEQSAKINELIIGFLNATGGSTETKE